MLKGINDESAGRYRSVQAQISGTGYQPPGPEPVGPQVKDLSDWLGGASLPGRIVGLSPIVMACAARTRFVTITHSSTGTAVWAGSSST